VIGCAAVFLGEHAVYLMGGSVRAEMRGRGAYRALVRARWDVAVERCIEVSGPDVLVDFEGRKSVVLIFTRVPARQRVQGVGACDRAMTTRRLSFRSRCEE
jgi:hypothetical protein